MANHLRSCAQCRGVQRRRDEFSRGSCGRLAFRVTPFLDDFARGRELTASRWA